MSQRLRAVGRSAAELLGKHQAAHRGRTETETGAWHCNAGVSSANWQCIRFVLWAAQCGATCVSYHWPLIFCHSCCRGWFVLGIWKAVDSAPPLSWRWCLHNISVSVVLDCKTLDLEAIRTLAVIASIFLCLWQWAWLLQSVLGRTEADSVTHMESKPQVWKYKTYLQQGAVVLCFANQLPISELNAACFCLSAGSPLEKLHVGFVWEWQRLGSGTCMSRCFYCEKNTGVGWSLNSHVSPNPFPSLTSQGLATLLVIFILCKCNQMEILWTDLRLFFEP